MESKVGLHKQGNINLILLDFLRTGIISAYLRQAGCNAAEEDVSSHLCSNDLEQYLLNHSIPPVSADEVHQLCHQILAQCGQPNCPEAFVADLNEMCPWLLKDNYLISLLRDNPLALYTAMYALVACSQNYVGQDAASGVRFVDEIYLPKEDMWQSLGISDISTFIRCWQSLNYYVCIEQNVYLPGVARDVLDLYSKNSIPSSVLLTQFSQMSVINGEIDDTEKDSTLFNPWVAWRRAAGMPQVEHGMTLEERAFIDDLFYSSFVHHANNICGISEGQLCYIAGRKGHNCFAEHYVDYRNDFVQLDIIQRLDRLWEHVCKAWRNPLICKDTEDIYNADHTITAAAAAGHLAHIDFSFIPKSPYESGDIAIRIECPHGVEGHIAFIP